MLRRTHTSRRRSHRLLPLLLTGSALLTPALPPAPGLAQLASDSSAASRRSAAPRTVVVVSGDTLEAISLRQGVSLSALIEANDLRDPGQLRVGQRLVLPPAGAVAMIRPGDTFEVLARRHQLSVSQLQAANPSLVPEQLPVGGWVRLSPPAAPRPMSALARPALARPTAASAAAPQPPDTDAQLAEAALLLSSAERRDLTTLALREASGQLQWKRYGNTLVDWNGWRLHPGGVRITLVKVAASDLGPRLALATAMAVQCGSLRQTWRVDGSWEPWTSPPYRSVAQQIVLDLCSNTLDGPAVPVPATAAP